MLNNMLKNNYTICSTQYLYFSQYFMHKHIAQNCANIYVLLNKNDIST